MTLLFTIFALVFVTELISWIGKSVLLELVSIHLLGREAHIDMYDVSCQAFAIYTSFFGSDARNRQRLLQSSVLADKAEMGRTSSQDQFAKWAKLRRKVDKGLADLEKLSEIQTLELLFKRLS